MRCGRIKEAGCQSAQTAVAQRCVVDFFKDVDINVLFSEELFGMLQHAHCIQVVVHHAAHEELCRQIVCTAVFGMVLFAVCPSLRDRTHHSLTECFMQFCRGKLAEFFAVVILCCKHQVVDNGIFLHLLVILQPSVNFS